MDSSSGGRLSYAPHELPVLVRLAEPGMGILLESLFSRYPDKEWGTFARFGWRETPQGLVVMLCQIDLPESGDMDEDVDNVAFMEPYTLRAALEAEKTNLAVGVVHSHPEGCRTPPSWVDDEMDGYFANYFSGFAPNRPYISLIFARDEHGKLSASGRVFWQGEWHRIRRFTAEGRQLPVYGYELPVSERSGLQKKLRERLQSAFGQEAADRLEHSIVALIGAGGTASPAIEAFARAGVGNLIVVDPENFAESNFERVHGSSLEDAECLPPKVQIAMRHIQQINPDCRVTIINGSLPQKEVIDALVWADVIVGCTDQEHSRVALSDLTTRYLIPALDCGVAIEGDDGAVSAQVIQMVKLLPADPCVYCRKMITQRIVSQELMSEQEQASRQAAAGAEGGANPYWQNQPQLNTVGYLTTIAGGMVAGYAIGLVTGRFAPPFSRLQMDLCAPWFNVTDDLVEPRPDCACRRTRGMADQGEADAFLSPPKHWKKPIVEFSH